MIRRSAVTEAVEFEWFKHSIGANSKGKEYNCKDQEDSECVFDDLDDTDNYRSKPLGEKKPT